MEQLNEKNLRQGTLKYLVDPIVEIDMYSPKIQQDSIVVVMRVEGSYDAGYDMSSFIEKLPFGVLDTEVQEIPNTEGYYEIFIEMERDDEFPANLMRILHDAGSLCAEENSEYVWQGILYAQDNEEPMDIDEKILRSHVRLHPEEQDIREFFEYSLDTVRSTRQSPLVKPCLRAASSLMILELKSSLARRSKYATVWVSITKRSLLRAAYSLPRTEHVARCTLKASEVQYERAHFR